MPSDGLQLQDAMDALCIMVKTYVEYTDLVLQKSLLQ